MSAADMSPLARRVFNCFSHGEDFGSGGPIDTVHGALDGAKSEREADLIDWGLTFGIAYGIARADDPFEADVDVSKRALAAAREALERYAGGDGSASRLFTSEVTA